MSTYNMLKTGLLSPKVIFLLQHPLTKQSCTLLDQLGKFHVICMKIFCECESMSGPVLNKAGLFDFNAFHYKHAKVSKACFLLRLQKACLCVYWTRHVCLLFSLANWYRELRGVEQNAVKLAEILMNMMRILHKYSPFNIFTALVLPRLQLEKS